MQTSNSGIDETLLEQLLTSLGNVPGVDMPALLAAAVEPPWFKPVANFFAPESEGSLAKKAAALAEGILDYCLDRQSALPAKLHAAAAAADRKRRTQAPPPAPPPPPPPPPPLPSTVAWAAPVAATFADVDAATTLSPSPMINGATTPVAAADPPPRSRMHDIEGAEAAATPSPSSSHHRRSHTTHHPRGTPTPGRKSALKTPRSRHDKAGRVVSVRTPLETRSLAELISNGNTPSLRKTPFKRSPGGTPHRKPVEPDLIVVELRKKFKNITNSPKSPSAANSNNNTPSHKALSTDAAADELEQLASDLIDAAVSELEGKQEEPQVEEETTRLGSASDDHDSLQLSI